jgi:hypothetical protein
LTTKSFEALPEVFKHIEYIVRFVFHLASTVMHKLEVMQSQIWNFASNEEITNSIERMKHLLNDYFKLKFGLHVQN